MLISLWCFLLFQARQGREAGPGLCISEFFLFRTVQDGGHSCLHVHSVAVLCRFQAPPCTQECAQYAHWWAPDAMWGVHAQGHLMFSKLRSAGETQCILLSRGRSRVQSSWQFTPVCLCPAIVKQLPPGDSCDVCAVLPL